MSAAPAALPPLSLYVHIPWCVRKCPYCDFNSHEARVIPEHDYVDALVRDLRQQRPRAQGRTLRSVFFGGGTPSLFSAASLGAVLEAAAREIGFAPDVEITLEANPGTVEHGNFADYRRTGINRVSFGVQSFDDARLQALGRIHSAAEARRAIELARAAGFDNINLDLMHGLPGQNIAGARADLDQALALAPEHLSWYQLTVEPNTAFYNHPPQLPADPELEAIHDAGLERLEQAGYRRYEVSAYAQPGRQARHNLNYWTFGDYLGIGAGAHGKLTCADGVMRTQATRLPRDYLQRLSDDDGSQPWPQRPVPREELAGEFMLNALRLADGFEPALFSRHTGLDWAAIAEPVAELIAEGLLERDGPWVRPSARGFDFVNDLVARFF